MTDYEKKLMRDFGLDAPDTSPRDPGRPAMSDVTELVQRLRVWADAADEGDRIAAQYALGKDADPALTSAMGDDLRAAAAAIERLTRERDEAREQFDFLFRTGVEPAVAAERERCAKVADDLEKEWAAAWRAGLKADIRLEAFSEAAEMVAAAIRGGQP